MKRKQFSEGQTIRIPKEAEALDPGALERPLVAAG